MPADVTTQTETPPENVTGVDVGAALAALKDVPHEPGAPKPDPIVVADGIKRQFGGLVAMETEAHMSITQSADCREAFRAFVEKRTPVFEGR